MKKQTQNMCYTGWEHIETRIYAYTNVRPNKNEEKFVCNVQQQNQPKTAKFHLFAPCLTLIFLLGCFCLLVFRIYQNRNVWLEKSNWIGEKSIGKQNVYTQQPIHILYILTYTHLYNFLYKMHVSLYHTE